MQLTEKEWLIKEEEYDEEGSNGEDEYDSESLDTCFIRRDKIEKSQKELEWIRMLALCAK